jgi:hypothetical protein
VGSRKLRLLRAHGIIRKVSGTYRYQLTETGRKAITALLTALRSTVRELLPEAARTSSHEAKKLRISSTERTMNEEDRKFRVWLKAKHPHVKLLLDEEVSIGDVNFVGGTMWTDFNGGDLRAMETAQQYLLEGRIRI